KSPPNTGSNDCSFDLALACERKSSPTLWRPEKVQLKWLTSSLRTAAPPAWCLSRHSRSWIRPSIEYTRITPIEPVPMCSAKSATSQEGNDMSQDAIDPAIEQLTRLCETKRQETINHILSRLRSKLSDADCTATEKALSRFQNQFLHGPIRAL